MKKYIQYNVATGEITQIFDCSENDSIEHLSGYGYEIIESNGDYSNGYVQNGELVPFPEKPSPYHKWDWTTKTWLPNLDAAKSAKKTEIEATLATKIYLPCNGFDADKVSRERISVMIARLQRGDGLPAGWIGWRDASNQQQWATDDAATVLANLTALSRAIEDREHTLLVASWAHKKNIGDLADLGDILSYDVTKNWPT